MYSVFLFRCMEVGLEGCLDMLMLCAGCLFICTLKHTHTHTHTNTHTHIYIYIYIYIYIWILYILKWTIDVLLVIGPWYFYDLPISQNKCIIRVSSNDNDIWFIGYYIQLCCCRVLLIIIIPYWYLLHSSTHHNFRGSTLQMLSL